MDRLVDFGGMTMLKMLCSMGYYGYYCLIVCLFLFDSSWGVHWNMIQKSNVIIFTYCFLFEDFWIYLYMDRYIPFISDPFWQRGNVWDGLNQSWSYKTRFPGFRFRTMEVENGPPCRWLKSSSFQGPIFHFHDYGRKGMWSPFEGWDLIFAWHVLYCLLNISNNDWQLYAWQLFRFYLKATRNLEVISLPWSPRSCTEQ